MRILLVNPWIYDFSAYDLWSKPLGLLYLSSILQNLGCQVELIDCLDRRHRQKVKSNLYGCGKYYSQIVEKPTILKFVPRYYRRFGLPEEIFRQELEKIPSPQIILITSGMTYWYQGVFEVIGILKDKFPAVPIVLGGTYATLCPEHAKKYSQADYVFSGGDVPEIIHFIEKVTDRKFNPEKIPKYFAQFPPPDYSFYPKLEYIVLRTSVGCPFHCTYCAVNKFAPNFQQKSAEKVVNEIEYLLNKYQTKNFVFYDDALLYNAENHIVKILRKIKEKKLPLCFHTPNGLHPRFFKEEIAGLLYETNFVQPRLSLETSNPEKQKQTGNKVTNEEFIRAIKYLQKAGYKTKDIGVYLMIGYPGQEFKEVYESINFVHQLGLKVLLVEYSPIPGTKDWSRIVTEKKQDFTDPLLQNNSIFPLYSPDSWQEFQKVKDYAHQLNQKLL